MLTLVACSLASEYFPELNVGLVAQFAAVHDLPEVYANDTSTLRLPSIEQARTKEQRERSATFRLHAEFERMFPWLVYTLRSYQLQDTPEKVFVWAVDKQLPKLLHILNRGATVREELATVSELTERYAIQNAQIRERASQFPQLADLHEILVKRMLAAVDAGPECPVTGESCPGNEHGQICSKPCKPNGDDQ
jgi:5'-deoxynucleotidase YfbR-like HD superfamily hydrolase